MHCIAALRNPQNRVVPPLKAFVSTELFWWVVPEVSCYWCLHVVLKKGSSPSRRLRAVTYAIIKPLGWHQRRWRTIEGQGRETPSRRAHQSFPFIPNWPSGSSAFKEARSNQNKSASYRKNMDSHQFYCTDAAFENNQINTSHLRMHFSCRTIIKDKLGRRVLFLQMLNSCSTNPSLASAFQ